MRFNLNHNDFGYGFHHMHMSDAGFATVSVLAALIGILALAYQLLIVPVFIFGSRLMFIQAVRGLRPDFDTLIKGFRENYLHIILADLLTMAIIGMSFIALIIPGIIVACRLAFTSYLVMDKKLDPIMAIEESWRMTKGHAWTIFFMALSSFFIIMIGLLFFVVGIFPAISWVKSSFASLYQAILLENEPMLVE